MRKFDRQTDKKRRRKKIRLIESIGPEGQCFENLVYRFLPLRWTRLTVSHTCKDQEKPIMLTRYIKDSHSLINKYDYSKFKAFGMGLPDGRRRKKKKNTSE